MESLKINGKVWIRTEQLKDIFIKNIWQMIKMFAKHLKMFCSSFAKKTLKRQHINVGFDDSIWRMTTLIVKAVIIQTTTPPCNNCQLDYSARSIERGFSCKYIPSLNLQSSMATHAPHVQAVILEILLVQAAIIRLSASWFTTKVSREKNSKRISGHLWTGEVYRFLWCQTASDEI